MFVLSLCCQALIHGLNRHYYSIAINYRKNELEQKMLLNLHKKKWTDGLILKKFDTHSKTNEETVQVCSILLPTCAQKIRLVEAANWTTLCDLLIFVLPCAGNAESGHQIQQGSARGGWAAAWETSDSKCRAAGCKEALGGACLEFDVIEHSPDPRDHARHSGFLVCYYWLFQLYTQSCLLFLLVTACHNAVRQCKRLGFFVWCSTMRRDYLL